MAGTDATFRIGLRKSIVIAANAKLGYPLPAAEGAPYRRMQSNRSTRCHLRTEFPLISDMRFGQELWNSKHVALERHIIPRNCDPLVRSSLPSLGVGLHQGRWNHR